MTKTAGVIADWPSLRDHIELASCRMILGGLFLAGVLARWAVFGFALKGVLKMTRKMISLAGVVIAALSFAVGGSDVEARHCRTHRNHCCRQSVNNGCQQNSNIGFRNNGTNGNCCQQSGNNGYQQTSNYASGQMTYGTTEAAVGVSQPAPPVESAAPVPVN